MFTKAILSAAIHPSGESVLKSTCTGSPGCTLMARNHFPTRGNNTFTCASTGKSSRSVTSVRASRAWWA